jgi:phenylalanyl-tRNA synthetase beta subunit
LGVKEWVAEPLAEGDGPWLAGRGAKLLINGQWVGCFGELDPSVASLYDLRVPLNGAELDITALLSAIDDPV